jgi:hypothetical protein
MRVFGIAFVLAISALRMQAEPNAIVTVDFSNPGLTPPKWTLIIHSDGNAHFHADRGARTSDQIDRIEPGEVDRDVVLSKDFATRVFDTVHRHKLLNENCESHLKVAFQGLKKIAYSGPDGQGACEFNYSKDKDIQTLGDSLVAAASTIVEGARLELMLQHDPLGLDKEMEFLAEASEDGRLQQMCAIQGVLSKLEDDPAVMERVRKRARQLLAASSSK